MMPLNYRPPAAIPKAFAKKFSMVVEATIHLQLILKAYDDVYLKSGASFRTVNEGSGGFFALVNGLMVSKLIIGSCRLTDPWKGKNGEETLGLEHLIKHTEYADVRERGELGKELNTLRAILKTVKSARDKATAHNDLALAIGAAPGFTIEIDMFRRALSKSFEILARIEAQYTGHRNDMSCLLRYVEPGLVVNRMAKACAYDELVKKGAAPKDLWERFA